MIPVVTPEEMREIDAAALEPESVLIERAGAAVARVAVEMMGGTYGRRVAVIAGSGNNGADGRVAVRRLARRGVGVTVFGVADAPRRLPACDLVIDAAFGTGLSRPYDAPDPGGSLVLAVDLPSGLDARTGELLGDPMSADVTVTFGALKPGLVLGHGLRCCGQVRVVDIGLDVRRATIGLVTDDDVASSWPVRSVDAHKWNGAVWVVGGSAGMTGAPTLAARGAQAAGAGYVRLSVPGEPTPAHAPIEAVAVAIPSEGWADVVAADLDRIGAVVLGPGLGRSTDAVAGVVALVGLATCPMVVDGDALSAIVDAEPFDPASSIVLTPHEGEFRRLTGHDVGPDRIAEVRELAASRRATVLLKGPTTLIAASDGRVALVTSGDQRLATAGTGDVLSGMIGALLANGLEPFDAARLAAHVHGLAGRRGPAVGTVASDVAAHVPGVLAAIRSSRAGGDR